jgi:hypothetical protein
MFAIGLLYHFSIHPLIKILEAPIFTTEKLQSIKVIARFQQNNMCESIHAFFAFSEAFSKNVYPLTILLSANV